MSEFDQDMTELEERQEASQSSEKQYVTGETCENGSCGCSGGNCGCGKKPCKGPIILGILVLIIALVAGGVYFYKQTFGSPLKKLADAYSKIYSQREMSGETVFSFEMDQDNQEMKDNFFAMSKEGMESTPEQLYNFVSKVLPNIQFKYSTNMNTKSDALGMGIGFDILYKDASIVDFLTLIKPWEVRVESTKILNQPLYVNLATLAKEQVNVDLTKIHLGDYIDVLYEEDEFTKNLKDSVYVKEVIALLKDKLTENGSKIQLILKNSETSELVKKFVEEAKKDEVLKKSILDKMNKIITIIAEKKDYEAFNIPKEQFDMFAMMAREQLETGYENILDELLEVYNSNEYQKALKENDPVISYIFKIKGDVLTEVETSTAMNGLKLKSVSRFVEKPKSIKELEEKKVEDFKDLSSFSSDMFGAFSYVMGAVDNLDKKVLKGDSFKSMAEDMKKEAVANLSPGDAEKLQEFFDNLPNVLQNAMQNMSGF